MPGAGADASRILPKALRLEAADWDQGIVRRARRVSVDANGLDGRVNIGEPDEADGAWNVHHEPPHQFGSTEESGAVRNLAREGGLKKVPSEHGLVHAIDE